ncbi:MAG: hypothetical protein Ct9H300mP22_2890 [Gammaproteobacteria bacterium]|nr:MAG: hypothetical protein Ct9H300mP22_2890 [Gammaproteobacteria bacterium]
MACGVAMKILLSTSLLVQNAGPLFTGVFFHFYIRKPLLQRELEDINPWLLKAVGVSSVMIWFTVAATGRWIGFSG